MKTNINQFYDTRELLKYLLRKVNTLGGSGGSGVTSVNGQTGAVSLNLQDVISNGAIITDSIIGIDATDPNGLTTLSQVEALITASSEDLESVTTGTGNNITQNAIHITSDVNLDVNTNGLVLINQGDLSTVANLKDGALTSGITFGTNGLSQKNLVISAGVSTMELKPETGLTSGAIFTTRVSGEQGINSNDFSTLAQLGLYIPLSQKGSANGVVPLNSSSVIDTTYLPSYVDDVLEYADLASFPVTGEANKVYIAIDSNKTYRWSGSIYVEIAGGVALGETSSTAYRGDRGKIAYDHSQITDGTNPHATTFANLISKPTTLSGYGITDAVIVGGQSSGGSLSIGTNDNNILNLRANNATRAVLTQTGNFLISGNITTNTATITPTHSLTIPSVGTGWRHYNTVDQTTNTESVTGSWSANKYNITVASTGTGASRSMGLNAGVAAMTIGGVGLTGVYNFAASASTTNISFVGITGTYSATSGIQNSFSILPTINQSSISGFRALWISPYLAEIGSGIGFLIDAGTNNSSSGSGAHTSRFTVDSAGNVVGLGFTGSNFTSNIASTNGLITMGTGGVATSISRNLNDSISAAVIHQIHTSSTGNILDLQFGSVTKASFDKDGNLAIPKVIRLSGATTSIDVVNSTLIDSTGAIALNYENRRLLNDTGTSVAKWNETILADTSAINSVNWGTRQLFNNTSGLAVLNWNTSTLVDPIAGANAMIWGNIASSGESGILLPSDSRLHITDMLLAAPIAATHKFIIKDDAGNEYYIAATAI